MKGKINNINQNHFFFYQAVNIFISAVKLGNWKCNGLAPFWSQSLVASWWIAVTSMLELAARLNFYNFKVVTLYRFLHVVFSPLFFSLQVNSALSLHLIEPHFFLHLFVLHTDKEILWAGASGTRKELDPGGKHGRQHDRGEGELCSTYSSARGEGPGDRQDMTWEKIPQSPSDTTTHQLITGQHILVSHGRRSYCGETNRAMEKKKILWLS